EIITVEDNAQITEGGLTDETTQPPESEETAKPLAESPTPEPTKEVAQEATPTPKSEPTKAPTAKATPKPTESPVPEPTEVSAATPKPEPTTAQWKAPAADMECRYTYTEQFSVKREGRLREDSYMKSEAEIYEYLTEKLTGRYQEYYLEFGAASSELVEAAARRLAGLPGMRSVAVEKKEYWSNGAAFSLKIVRVPEFSLLCAWQSGDTSELSEEGLATLKKAEEITALAEAFATDYEKEKFLHDYLVLNTVYDTKESDTAGQTAYGALVEGRCVCMGYTNAFHLLLTMSGIDSLIVQGEAGGEAHAWNKVWLDGAWYNVDVTWDDPVPDVPGEVEYAYFNVTDAFLAKNHAWNYSESPEAFETEYNYLLRTRKSLCTREEVAEYCREGLATGSETVEFIYAGEPLDLQELVQELQCGIQVFSSDCQGGELYRITFRK
ncbi:MAG: transglutaminase domain-containing protein, partial [Lachnospiraceae bacterium]